MKQFLATFLCGSLLFAIGCDSKADREPKSTVETSSYEQPAAELPENSEDPQSNPVGDGAQAFNSGPPPALPAPAMEPPREPTDPVDDAPPGTTTPPEFAAPEDPAIPPAPSPANPLRTFGASGFSAPRMGTRSYSLPPRSFAAEPTPAAAEPSFPEESAPFEDAAPPVAMAPAPIPSPMMAPPPAAAELSSAPVLLPSGAAPESVPIRPSAPVRAQGADLAAPFIPRTTPGNDPFDVVQVFYGTDRQAIEPVGESWSAHLHRFLPTGLAAFVALLFAVLASCVPSYRRVCSTLAACGVAATLVLGTLASNATIDNIRQAAKEGIRYTTERSDGGKVELGICEVTIPKTHKSGELEAPSITRLEISEDARKHVVLRKTERLQNQVYYQMLRERVAQSSRKELFVFIHGFNTSFEDAARRTAQMTHDLPFEGAPIFYSWPANNMYLLTYPADETNVAWTVPHLKRFLLEIVHESDARSINLVAHSMGNRALTTALRELDLEFKGEARLFNQVVLAAPDIDAADFRDNIAPAIRNTAQRVTLYASSADQALAASHLVHRYPRAGDTLPDLVIADGLDTIDVSHVGTSPWGHSYYGASDPILHDLRMLMQEALPPMERHWLSQADYRGRPYWIFQDQNPATSTRRSVIAPR